MKSNTPCKTETSDAPAIKRIACSPTTRHSNHARCEPGCGTPYHGTRHFYLRTREGAPIGVVVLVPRGNEVLVGTSLCARTDAWDRDKGRMIAYGRATNERSMCAVYVGDHVPSLRSVLAFQCGASRIADVDMTTASRVYTSMIEHALARFGSAGVSP